MQSQPVVAGAGIVSDSRPKLLFTLSQEVSDLSHRLAQQQGIIDECSQNFTASLANGTEEQQAAWQSRLSLASAQRDRLESEYRGAKARLDAEQGRIARHDEQNRLENEFKQAGERLNESRAVIEKLRAEQTALPGRLADAMRTFRNALDLWNQRKAACDALRWQRTERPINGAH
jgi:chromosome segregation ATPase